MTTMADETRSLRLNQFIPYQLVNLAKRVSDSCSSIYSEQFGISIAEWRVLARLGEHTELNSRGLGERTLMDKSRVSRALKQLEDKGYLSRRLDGEDNRASYLALTEAGRNLYSKITPQALKWEAELLSALDVPEYRDLLRIIEKLEGQLDLMDQQ
jgi:DNA-binding MarR family transcriptional regulator